MSDPNSWDLTLWFALAGALFVVWMEIDSYYLNWKKKHEQSRK